jgi:hypothetical protein
MKTLHISFLWILCLGLLTHKSHAQLSVGLGGTYTYYIAGTTNYPAQSFPLLDLDALPSIVGGKIIGSYGFLDQNAVRFGIGYNMGLKEMPFMVGTSAKLTALEVSIDYQRYLMGSHTGGGGLYAFGGFGFLSSSLAFTVPDPVALANTGGDAKYFVDRSIQLTTFNVGLGGETLALNKFYIFAEAHFATHLNAYIDNTTIKQSNMMHYIRGMAGVRIPFGGTISKKYPKRRRF